MCVVDELALLFTGLPAPQTVHLEAQDARVPESIDVDEGNDDAEDESEAAIKDESLIGVSAPPIPPSINPSSFACPGRGPLPSPDDPSAHSIHPSLRDPDARELAHPLFTITQLGVDRRLLVNRKRQLKMYRVWMQGKFQRTEADALPLVSELDKSRP
jgi:tRNAThr (cytosine32-N3)-methyltransferase